MEEKIKILIVDDEPRVADEIEEFLHTRDYIVSKANAPSKAFKILKKDSVNIVILDIKLPEMDGIEVLKKIKALYPDIEVIMISGHGDMEIVIQAMRYGATDYFAKPFRLFEIDNAISRTTKYLRLNQKLKTAEQNVHELSKKIINTQGARLIGNSKPMKTLIDLMEKVAKAENTSVLILGESGTGKELVAHGIHQLSKRSNKMFYSVNCSAVPESLFESEFFGHKKGAFTGAVEDKSGWFEISNNGTLFLDEISDMPLGQQAKLLRVLEERKVSKVGSRNSVNVDVRVVAASNTKLEELASENKFRLDLYHRLSVFIINVPPLRDRKEDIPLLFNYYLEFYNKQMQKQVIKVDNSVMISLMSYNFPGNIRELRNIVERAVILCDGDTIKTEHVTLSGDLNPISKDTYSNDIQQNENLDLEYHERELIKMALKRTDNNKSKAAAMLNVTWQALDRRMKKFELE
ncbi:MAG: sigma-54 dependent transcriptional regulator [Bacteroidales bacterium]|jgi:DNA-binding NtrC family response regulator|nr:sigma-54 dependent transcriptional regulator [Bacteroidales bacterium]MDG2080651.1 sigma-54 dependent transcriptional regulator [Bacteroidales bacterium]|tara:strand:- start:4407 stop:5795 length:1389 start_codon:yes stop_codon:yes gene_type:complete